MTTATVKIERKSLGNINNDMSEIHETTFKGNIEKKVFEKAFFVSKLINNSVFKDWQDYTLKMCYNYSNILLGICDTIEGLNKEVPLHLLAENLLKKYHNAEIRAIVNAIPRFYSKGKNFKNFFDKSFLN
jgi:thiamine kinase-like enzyme